MIAARLAALLLPAALSLVALGAAAQDIATYRNERYGFAFSYPSAQFSPQSSPADDYGRVFVSEDGSARLLAGALPNADGMKLREYREFVLQQSYPGAAIDYAPVSGDWFVLSGTREGMMFYERVTFTCGGRLINSWAMQYPAAERRVYDRIVEQVARSYRPGAANCG